MSAESPQAYLESVPEIGRPWLREFWDHVEQRSPTMQAVMFRGVPMYRFADTYQKGYVMFTAAQTHFAVHAIDFDLIAAAQKSIPKAAGGKGSVTVKYPNEAAKPALKQLVDAVLARHGFLE